MRPFEVFQILLISALAVVMSLSADHSPAESDADNDTLMNRGVWVAEIQGWEVIPGTTRRLGPPGTFHQPMINRAGTWITFWGSETGKQGGDIWIAATDGSHWQQLTFDGSGNEGPQWSPDGQLIVYSSTRGSPRSHVWIMNADGSNNRQLTFDPFGGARPAFHPDGNTIVFTSNPPGAAIHWRTEANLWQTDLSGRTTERITKHGGLDFKANFSPNGQYLAYHTDQTKTGKHNLAIHEWPDGTNSRQPVAISGEEWLHGPFWSFDNTHILVHGYLKDVNAGRLYLVDAFTGHVQTVNIPGFIAWGHGSVNEAETFMAFGGRRYSIPPIAVISATPLSGKTPLRITFDGTNSTDINGHLVSYSWDFGDGAKATGAALSHTYSSVGTYTAVLTVTDDQELKHSDSIIITVKAVME
jgi:Tol biopolymer transport system component